MSGPETRLLERGNVEHIRPNANTSRCRTQTSHEFIRGFRPPDYLMDGILQRGFLYSFTGATGSGKTAIALRVMAHVALGQPFAARDVQQGAVAMLVGENADDVRMRWIALSVHMGFVADNIPVHFVPEILSVQEFMPDLASYANGIGGFALVIVDTSAAYFLGDEENSNKQLGDHARALRELTNLPGHPTVIVNCHPTKHAQEDNLLPRGGGAFIAEVDGNLTCRKVDGAVDLHWQGKFRGPEFEPIGLALESATTDLLRDSRGRNVPTVYARPLTGAEREAQALDANSDARVLLATMASHPNASLHDLAEAAGWVMGTGQPYRSKVQRVLGTLKKQGLVSKELDVWTLTNAGEKAANRGLR